ncbi:hypothetical protein NF681_09705 [Comamonadaceae bacterium OTU4NAUVB1]|jgi:hypothetical protein|nr:hypothetical protein NF681_09705 [Comamonadaceae bacterium OTU4NAUVB1]
MNTWKTTIGISLLLLIIFLLFKNPSDPPYFKGPFQWSRMEVKMAQTSGASAFPVYASIDRMNEIFQMEVGDECYFLKDDGWRWRDTKDPAFALAPVFCPGKGGGWTMLPGT